MLLAAPLGVAAQPAPNQGCRINVTALDFGDYSALDPFPDFALGRVIVDCRGSGDFPDRVTVSSGRGGNPHRRAMVHGNAVLFYNIYSDPARRRVAGDGSAGTTPLVPRLRTAGRNIFVLFGAIAPQQPVPAGNYDDRLRVELEF